MKLYPIVAMRDISKNTPVLLTHLMGMADTLIMDVANAGLSHIDLQDLRVFHLTHKDGDAVGCDLAVRYFFNDVVTRTWDYYQGVDKLAAYIGESSFYDLLIITDISIRDESIQLLDKIKTRPYIWIDHHASSEWVNDCDDLELYKRSIIQHKPITAFLFDVDNGTPRMRMLDNQKPAACILTYLFIRALIHRDGIDVLKLNGEIDDIELANIITRLSLYDTFEFTELTIPAYMNALMREVRKADQFADESDMTAHIPAFSRAVLNGDIDIKLDENYITAVLNVMDRFKEKSFITPIPKHITDAIQSINPEVHDGVRYVELKDLVYNDESLDYIKSYISMAANFILKETPGVEMVAWKIDNTYSFRSLETARVTALQIATVLGGGGHIAAAGATINE